MHYLKNQVNVDWQHNITGFPTLVAFRGLGWLEASDCMPRSARLSGSHVRNDYHGPITVRHVRNDYHGPITVCLNRFTITIG